MDARQIEKCIDLFGAGIYRFCLKLCANKIDAEDLYQQTFLKALESNCTLDWEQNPKALFFSYKLWQSDIRKKARRSSIAPCSNSEQIRYSLAEFKNEKIHVRLQINGVEDSAAAIYIK